jgi:RNA methyltransferase, TrmH family
MLSKGLIKTINSLDQKKYREKSKLFVAEGEKLVSDLIRMGAPVKKVISSKQISNISSSIEYIECNPSEMDKISFVKNNQGVLSLVEIVDKDLNLNLLHGKLSLGLDGIQDPGNMGTIIRLANWFGISNILCSRECVDVYNPKVIQASMGAFAGVNIFYTELESSVDALIKVPDYQVYGGFMEAESIYSANLESNGILIMGNEGNGISKAIENKISRRISIPAFYIGDFKAESLNVGVATGIILSEFVRQTKLN